MKKLIYGVGIRTEGKYKVTEGGKHTPIYTLWKNMLARCYSASMQALRPSYTGCKVEGDFLDFQKFAEWYESQSTDPDVEYQLDKDLLTKGNKTYSKNHCVLVPRKVNMFLCKSDAARGTYPIGVTYDKRYGKFKAQVSDSGQHYNSYHDTVQDAFAAYKFRKEQIALRLAEMYSGKCDARVIAALRSYTVEDTD